MGLLKVTLAGLPELDKFPSDKERSEALQQIGTEAGNVRSGGYWLAIAILVGSVLLARTVAGFLLAQVSWPNWIEDGLKYAAMVLAFIVIIRRLHRWGAASSLREKLLAAGVPVCRKCGYTLIGLPLTPGRCPECGKAFDEAVRAILLKSPASDGDSPAPRA